MKLVSWNIGRNTAACWDDLANSDADLALVQEARAPNAAGIEVSPAPWRTDGAKSRPWRAAVARLSNRVEVRWFQAKSLHVAREDELAVSQLGTLEAAKVTPASGEAFIVVSMYGLWAKPHAETKSSWIYADGSVHRLISDLSAFIGQQRAHSMPIIAAGDLNVLYGYGEDGNVYWQSRYATVFSRMSALGLAFAGPQAPNGRCAEPWPAELPSSSHNVPTYYTVKQNPVTATRQLDFVLVSNSLIDRVRVEALNQPDEWGPSDHCRLAIEVE